MLQTSSIPDDVTTVPNRPDSFIHTTPLGLTQPLTEMSNMNLPGCKGRPAQMANNGTTICEP
jgi:hypothetical protein